MKCPYMFMNNTTISLIVHLVSLNSLFNCHYNFIVAKCIWTLFCLYTYIVYVINYVAKQEWNINTLCTLKFYSNVLSSYCLRTIHILLSQNLHNFLRIVLLLLSSKSILFNLVIFTIVIVGTCWCSGVGKCFVFSRGERMNVRIADALCLIH